MWMIMPLTGFGVETTIPLPIQNPKKDLTLG